MWDNHMHCSFSGDSTADPVDMILSAKAKGLDGITFTDHLDIDYKEEPGLFDLNLDNYYIKQQELAKKYTTDDFTILTGIEIGLRTDLVKENLDAVASNPFDFVIGSTHVVDLKDPYYKDFWDDDYKKKLTRYYEVIYENIRAFKDFDTLAHLDYCFRYVPVRQDADTYTPYSEIVDAILSEIITKDKALEVNAGAFIKGFSQPNPCDIIIKRYRELGGKLITIGADAHKPENVGCRFDLVKEILLDCGFTEQAVYKKRIPTLYSL